MAALATGVGALVFLYSFGYMSETESRGTFYPALAAFQAAMVGLVLADNGTLLFLFWELTSYSSFLLISHNAMSPAARRSAKNALFVTGLGGLGLLIPMSQYGPYLIHEGGHLGGSWIGIGCVVLAVMTKSAQFPFSGWLPGAMAAPTPVSAYLHSATMVQAGVYLSARLAPELGIVGPLLQHLGSATALFALFRICFAVDLKQILAFSTLGALGALMAQATIPALSGQAPIFLLFLVGHAFYKAGLFFVAGAIERSVGSRDVRSLRGLFWTMPVTGIAGFALAISALGLPFSLGGVGKSSLAHLPSLEPSLWLSAIGGVIAAYRVGIRPFVGARNLDLHPHESPAPMLASIGILAILGLAGGVAVSNGGSGSLSAGFLGPVSIAGVILLITARLHLRLGNGLEQAFRQLGVGIANMGLVFQWVFQGGQLSNYLRWVICSLGILLIWASTRGPALGFPAGITVAYPLDSLLIALAIIAAVTTAVLPSRLGAVAAMGIVGWAVAMVYSLYGAPDLAMTQLAVEVLTLILFVFTLGKLPRLPDRRNAKVRSRDATIAGLVGLGMASMCYLASNLSPLSSVSREIAERALPEAFGRNIVNVILVDFRALDTLGEITVLCVAGIGVYTLLRRRTPAPESSTESLRGGEQA